MMTLVEKVYRDKLWEICSKTFRNDVPIKDNFINFLLEFENNSEAESLINSLRFLKKLERVKKDPEYGKACSLMKSTIEQVKTYKIEELEKMSLEQKNKLKDELTRSSHVFYFANVGDFWINGFEYSDNSLDNLESYKKLGITHLVDFLW